MPRKNKSNTTVFIVGAKAHKKESKEPLQVGIVCQANDPHAKPAGLAIYFFQRHRTGHGKHKIKINERIETNEHNNVKTLFYFGRPKHERKVEFFHPVGEVSLSLQDIKSTIDNHSEFNKPAGDSKVFALAVLASLNLLSELKVIISEKGMLFPSPIKATLQQNISTIEELAAYFPISLRLDKHTQKPVDYSPKAEQNKPRIFHYEQKEGQSDDDDSSNSDNDSNSGSDNDAAFHTIDPEPFPLDPFHLDACDITVYIVNFPLSLFREVDKIFKGFSKSLRKEGLEHVGLVFEANKKDTKGRIGFSAHWMDKKTPLHTFPFTKENRMVEGRDLLFSYGPKLYKERDPIKGPFKEPHRCKKPVKLQQPLLCSLVDLIKEIKTIYSGRKYDFKRQNCQHFVVATLQKLGLYELAHEQLKKEEPPRSIIRKIMLNKGLLLKYGKKRKKPLAPIDSKYKNNNKEIIQNKKFPLKNGKKRKKPLPSIDLKCKNNNNDLYMNNSNKNPHKQFDLKEFSFEEQLELAKQLSKTCK